MKGHLRLKEIAYQAIREKILGGAFAPGVRIREEELAREIGMSRTPVREAVQQLAAEGLLDQVPHYCSHLAVFSDQAVADLLEVRQALESLAVVRCILRLTDTRLARLKAIHKAYGRALKADDAIGCLKQDLLFHREIASQSGNQVLIEHLQLIEAKIHIMRITEKLPQPMKRHVITHQEHQAIVDAIENKDKTEAVLAVRTNIRHLKQLYFEVQAIPTESIG